MATIHIFPVSKYFTKQNSSTALLKLKAKDDTIYKYSELYT